MGMGDTVMLVVVMTDGTMSGAMLVVVVMVFLGVLMHGSSGVRRVQIEHRLRLQGERHDDHHVEHAHRHTPLDQCANYAARLA